MRFNQAMLVGKEGMMRVFAVGTLLGFFLSSMIAAGGAQSPDCNLCREDYKGCVKAHTQGACKTNYDICMRHCRKK
jgi:hypothetical protein